MKGSYFEIEIEKKESSWTQHHWPE